MDGEEQREGDTDEVDVKPNCSVPLAELLSTCSEHVEDDLLDVKVELGDMDSGPMEDLDVLSLIGASAVECGAFEENFMSKLEEHLNELEKEEGGAALVEDTAQTTQQVVDDQKTDSSEKIPEEGTSAGGSIGGFCGSILKRALERKITEAPLQENNLQRRKDDGGHVKDKKKNDVEALKAKNVGKKKPVVKDLNFMKPAEETEEERQIRTGEMTPFGTMISKTNSAGSSSFMDFQRYLNSQKAFANVRKPQVKAKSSSAAGSSEKIIQGLKKKRASSSYPFKMDDTSSRKKIKATESKASARNVRPEKGVGESPNIAMYEEDSDYKPPSDASDEDFCPEAKERIKPERKVKPVVPRKKTYKEADTDDSFSEAEEDEVKKFSKRGKKEYDDGDAKMYKQRVEEWKANEVRFSAGFHSFPGGFKLPQHIWDSLFDYQKVGVNWMWELHQKSCGGILGDEMGLGKTIQVITFLAGISCSNMLWRFNSFRGLGPTIIVCPATVMHQWVKEFHTWWPPFRCVVLHESGSYTGSKIGLIKLIGEKGGVLITSYVGLVNSLTEMLKYSWHYVILDEGHKIRNPDAQITLAVKQIPTPHRLILSGSPLQNNLKELWSLFDFVFPGKLGTLPTFMEQFAVPITQGGYANASDVQVAAAFKCATVLRDIINPYLLRRMKSDVKHHVSLPPKSEQVLFCKLTDEQKACYINYLQSKEIDSIVQGRYNLFVGLINLRKICNHPHLFDGGPRKVVSLKPKKVKKAKVKGGTQGKVSDGGDLPSSYKSLKAEVSDKEEGETSSDSDIDFGPDDAFGHWTKSGKMIVLETLLKLWKKQNHKVLLFSQSRQMLCILENFVRQQGYTYLRLDGGTNIAARQPLIQRFNEDPSLFVFILTTKVGGLGVNLTGANRVIIFDPDWNPSTDLQARERAWRIGQDRQVTIYRLITSGTIEEKIYHRQIFKQFLTNRVLKNPKQKRFFKSSDVVELFSFNEGKSSESEAIFAGTNSKVKIESRKRKRRRASKGDDDDDDGEVADGFAESTNHEEEPREKSSGKFRGVPHLVKQRSQKNDPVAEKAEGEDQKQDEYVLKKLFRKSGVQAALKHDKILESNESDYLLVEKEAERVAADAVKLLKKSREQCWAADTGRVTWTGTSGTVRTEPPKKKLRLGRSKPTTTITKPPEPKEPDADSSFFSGPKKLDIDDETLSSADLIAAIRARKRPILPDAPSENSHSNTLNGEGSAPEESPGPSNNENLDHVQSEHIEMLREIREFIAFRAQVDGQASTKELLQEFGNKLPAKESPLFKQMLNQLCSFRRVDGHGIWKLKPEFR